MVHQTSIQEVSSSAILYKGDVKSVAMSPTVVWCQEAERIETQSPFNS